MSKDKITYLNIPLTPDIADKLGINLDSRKLDDKEILNLEFEAGNSQKFINASLQFDKEINSNEKLNRYKYEIKEFLVSDLKKAIDRFKEILKNHSDTFDSIILLAAKNHRINQAKHKNVISFQEAEIEISKIENAVMYMVNNMNEDELE